MKLTILAFCSFVLTLFKLSHNNEPVNNQINHQNVFHAEYWPDSIKYEQLLLLCSEQFDSMHIEKAMDLANQAEQLALRRWEPTDEHLATAYNSLGFIHLRMNNIQQCEHYIQLLSNIQPALPASEFAIFTFLQGSFALRKEDTTALSTLKLAEHRFLRLPSTAVRARKFLGKCYLNIAIDQKNKRQFPEGLGWIDKSEQILKENYPQYHAVLGQVEALKGLLLREWGKSDSALIHLRYAKDIYSRCLEPQHLEMGNLANNIGLCIYDQGSSVDARNWFNQAIQIAGKRTEGRQLRSYALNNLAMVAGHERDFEEQMNIYQRALAIDLAMKPRLKNDIAIDYSNMATAVIDQCNYLKDTSTLHRAQHLLDSAIFWIEPNNDYYAHKINHQKARLYLLRGQLGTARQIFEAAGQDIESYYNLVQLHLKEKNYPKARFYSDQLSTVAQDFIENATNKNFRFIAGQLLTQHCAVMAANPAAYQSEASLQEIIQFSEKILFTWEYLINQQKESNDRYILREEALPCYEALIAAELGLWSLNGQQKHKEQAFMWSEKAKSQDLRNALYTNQNPKEYTEVLQQEKQLRLQIQQTNNNALNNLDSLAKNQARMRALDNYLTFKQKIQETNPVIFKEIWGQLPTPLNALQRDIIQPDETLLSYFCGNDTIYIFSLDQKEINYTKVVRDFSLSHWVQKMTTEGIQKTEKSINGRLNYTESAYFLYQKLIQPIQSFLRPNLVVIPDDALHYIPFDALLEQKPNDDSYHKYHYLLHKYAVSYVASASLLGQMNSNSAKQLPSRNTALVFSAFSKNAPGELRNSKGRRFWQYPTGNKEILYEFEHSSAEVAAVSEHFSIKLLQGTDATLEQLKQNVANYPIVHFSTHGFAHYKKNENSWLAVDLTANGTFQKLYAEDIQSLRLLNKLVVLSACQTATGPLFRTEGLLSISRAFTEAGVSSIACTLWQVPERSTTDLMRNFYGELSQSIKAKALTAAKKKFIAEKQGTEYQKAHPYYWSGFIWVGSTGN
jgi:CHAT domain-containing protein